MTDFRALDALIAHMAALLVPLAERGDPRRHFHATYLRTTRAVRAELAAGGFRDPAWVERWDVAFAELYFDALDADQRGRQPPGPWAVAFAAPATLSPLQRVRLGMNAHINYDLPLALLAVIGDADFEDPRLLARRAADHRQVDRVLVARVGAEEEALGVPRTRLGRLLGPVSRGATRHFLTGARARVWTNARGLAQARRRDRAGYADQLARLELLATARALDLTSPGRSVRTLAVHGFGIALFPARTDHPSPTAKEVPDVASPQPEAGSARRR